MARTDGQRYSGEVRWVLAFAIAMGLCTIAGAHPPQDGKACRDCHPDAHQGELGARDCGACHALTAWKPSTFGAAQHAKWKLDGRHVATPCRGCHTGTPRVSFVIPQQDCLDCHQNPHGTTFAEQQAAAGCGGCHGTGNWKAWKATAAGPLDHRAWPLTGAHDRIACAACHPGRAATAPAAAFRGVARDCAKCHDDLHVGQFATASPSGPAKPCTSCHTTESFREPFDHTRTRYALDGVHVGMACAKCHPETELRSGERATRWRLGYAACRDCHANPHPSTQLDCKSCHGSTTWRGVGGAPASFDHAATGFVLRGAHRTASCGGCHGAAKRPPTDCQACHRDPHAGRVEGACAECHRETGWNDVAALERHRRTRMPLTGKHAAIECAACHRRQGERAWSDVPVDCYACHAAGYRNATMPDHDGATPLSRDCARCHVTVAWSPALDSARLARMTTHLAMPLTGEHRAAACEACHVDARRRKLVRCDGCHTMAKLRTQHASQVSPLASTCLACHPRGARR